MEAYTPNLHTEPAHLSGESLPDVLEEEATEPEITAAHWTFAEEAAREHGEDIGARIFRSTDGDRELTHDILQETYFRLARACARGQIDPANKDNNIPGWLNTVSSRLLISVWRREQVVKKRLGRPIDGDPTLTLERSLLAPSHEREALENVASDLAFAALKGTMNPDFLNAFIACEILGMPIADYARLVGVSQLTINTRRHRARKILRQLFAENPDLLELFGGPQALEGRVKK